MNVNRTCLCSIKLYWKKKIKNNLTRQIALIQYSGWSRHALAINWQNSSHDDQKKQRAQWSYLWPWLQSNFTVEGANRLFVYWESNRMNLTDQTDTWSCYIPGNILSSAPENRKGNLTSNKETFFFSRHFAPLFTAHRTVLTTSPSDVYIGICHSTEIQATRWDVMIEADLFQLSIFFCAFCFWQEFVSDEMLFNLFFGSGWRTRTFIWWICSGKNRSASLFLSPRMCVCWMFEINEL